MSQEKHKTYDHKTTNIYIRRRETKHNVKQIPKRKNFFVSEEDRKPDLTLSR